MTGDDVGRRVRSDRFGRLPPTVRLEDTVAQHDVRPVPDPQAGRDTERDFLLRFAML